MRFLHANRKQQIALPEHIKKSVDDVRSTGFWALGLGISGASAAVIGIALFRSSHPNLGHLLVVAAALTFVTGTVFLRGPSSSESVEWITTLGDRPEFDHLVAQIVTALNDD